MSALRRSRTRAAGGVLLVLALLGVVVVGLAWTLQRSLIYFPDTTAVRAAAEVIPEARDLTLHTADGLQLDAWLVPADPAVDRELAVLLAPGNGGHREGRAGLARELSRHGFAVLLLDYRGYGGNPGSPDEEGLAADALAAAEALEQEGYPPERTIYFGESLGTGVVAALQSRRPPAGVVLRSPFTELADVGRHHYPFLPVGLILRDRYPVVAHLKGSAVPVSVVRGDRDSVIPTELSAQVARSAPTLVEEHVIEGADHNDPVMFGPEVAGVVARLADSFG